MTVSIFLKSILFLGFVFIFSCNPKEQVAPQGFQMEPGFNLTLVASEPLIKDPVDLEFN